jgi:UDP-N-acetylglucosamine acyltransferase
MARVHPTAIVDPSASCAEDAVVGPYCVLGPGVVLEGGVELHAHVSVAGETRIGANTKVFPFVSLGQPAQIYRAEGPAGRLEIGPRCELREHVTINCGSPKGGGVTRLGADSMLMVGAHVAHDCQVGEGVIFANNATLGGHVEVGDRVFLGGLCAIHQFTRIGAFAMIAGTTGVRGDVIPYGMVAPGGKLDGYLAGLNVIGMRRLGMTRSDVRAVRAVYRELFYGPGLFADRVAVLWARADLTPAAKTIVEFVRDGGKRDLTLPARREASDDEDA